MGGRGSAVTFVIEVSFEHNQVELCVKQSKMSGSQLLFLFFFLYFSGKAESHQHVDSKWEWLVCIVRKHEK